MGAKRSLVSLERTHLQESVDLKPLAGQLQGLGHKLDERRKSLPSLDAPFVIREMDLKELVLVAEELAANSDTVVILASGLASAISPAALGALQRPAANPSTRIIFAGDHLSADFYRDLGADLESKKFSVIAMCSDEPSYELRMAVRYLYKKMREKFCVEECQRRLVFSTPATEQVFGSIISEQKFRNIPVSSRFKAPFLAFSPVGLLPLACAGHDVEAFLEGGRSLARSMDKQDFDDNECYQYAAIREVLTSDGQLECLTIPDPRLRSMSRWWRHLMNITHSLMHPSQQFPVSFSVLENRYLQQSHWDEGGITWETHLWVAEPASPVPLECAEMKEDGLEEWSELGFADFAEAMLEELERHHGSLEIPQLRLTIPKLGIYELGALFCFVETAANLNQKLGDISSPRERAAHLNPGLGVPQ